MGRTTLQVYGQVLSQGALPQPTDKGRGWRADIWTRRAAHSAQTWPHSAPRAHAPAAHIASRCSTASSAGWTAEDRFLPKENGKAGPRVQQATGAGSVCRSPPCGYQGLLCRPRDGPGSSSTQHQEDATQCPGLSLDVTPLFNHRQNTYRSPSAAFLPPVSTASTAP